MNFSIQRNAPVEPQEIEELRAAAGWDHFGKFDKVLANSYSHYTIREQGSLIGFLNVLSDGVADAFLLDLLVSPKFQKKGIGQAIVVKAVADLTKDGIQCIQVTFAPELEPFYQKCGFYIFKAGIIDNKAPKI